VVQRGLRDPTDLLGLLALLDTALLGPGETQVLKEPQVPAETQVRMVGLGHKAKLDPQDPLVSAAPGGLQDLRVL